ncbi:MAG: hypothetical protein PPP55_05855 [Halorubrum sp.]
MSRAVPLATGFLVGVCVFAWLAGPVLETRFGVEALVAAYGAVAVGTAVTTYVVVRRLDARLARSAGESAESTDRSSAAAANDGTDADGADTVTVSLDDLDDLDVEREVRQLKAERSGGDEE